MTRILLLALSLLVVAAGETAAQKNCTKGKLCGNTCIARDKVCRIGPARPATATVAPAAAASTDSPVGDSARAWVASKRGSVYYRNARSCRAVKDLVTANLIYFSDEKAATAAGYTRSSQDGC